MAKSPTPSAPAFSVEDLKDKYGIERVLRQFSQQMNRFVPIQPQQPLDLSALIKALSPGIRDELQASGAAPLDLTDLLPGSAGVITEDTHANRLVLYDPPSSASMLFWETDRHVIYVSVQTGMLEWHFAAGVMIDVAASRPVDLSTDDAAFLFFASDTDVLSIWDGATWTDITYTPPSGYWSELTNGDLVTPELIFAGGDTIDMFVPT